MRISSYRISQLRSDAAFRWLRIVLAGCLCAATGFELRAADAMLEAFTKIFSPLDTEAAAISPDGKRVAFSKRENDGVSVYIVELDTGAGKRVPVARDVQHPRSPEKSLARIRQVFWSGPDFLVIQQRDYPASEFFAVDAGGTRVRSLFDWKDPEWDRIGIKSIAPKSLTAVVPQPNDPGFATIAVQGIPHVGSGNYYIGIYRIELATGKWTRQTADEFPGRFLYDGNGAVRGKHTDRANPQAYFFLPPSQTAPKGWRSLAAVVPPARAVEFGATSENYFAPRSLPIGFGREPHHLYYASSVGRDAMGFYALDLETGEPLVQKVEDDSFDVITSQTYWENVIVRDPHTGKLAGVRYTRLKKTTHWFDEEMAAVQRRLEEKSTAFSVEIVGWDRARTRFLALRYSRSDPGDYFVYDAASDRGSRIAARAPALAQTLDRIETQSWAVERPTGRPLTGYLTSPDRSDGGPRPVVVMFPSEMWARPGAGFQPEVAAFARMGFAVLEVNHRGLAGFGLEHWQAGRGRLDEAATEDVVAALDELGRRGTIDVKRVAVYGWQFGGYLALRTLQLHPERFACGVVANAPSDLGAFFNDFKIGPDQAMRFRQATEKWFFGTDKVQLRAQSPLFHPRPIGRPVMLLEDTERQFVTPYRFADLRRKMERDRDAVTHSSAGGLLSLSGPKGNPLAYASIEAYLAKHLASQAQSK